MNNLEFKILNISDKKKKHKHSYAQIIMALDSYVYVQTEYDSFVIDNSFLAFIPPNCLHEYKCNCGLKALVINIPESLVKKSDLETFKNNMRYIMDERVNILKELMVKELLKNPDSEAIKYLFFYLYDRIVEHKSIVSIDYINKHYDEDVNISFLAKLEHYNTNYYSEWFKKQTGISPTDYLQMIRIEKAKELLITTNYSIGKISMQVGYDHNSSFTRIFKKFETMSPNEYRRTNRM